MDFDDLSRYFRYLPDEVKTLVYVSAFVALALCIFFLPEKRRASLGKALKAIHDFLNFKVFIIEKIFQFLYLTLTIAMFLAGIYAFAEGAEEGSGGRYDRGSLPVPLGWLLGGNVLP